MAIDYGTPEGQVRLLINDDNETRLVFSAAAIAGFLTLEGDNVKRAAAQALDVIADDEALTSKYIRTQDLATDGPKVADSLRKRATSLRAQADDADANGDDGAYFEITPMNGCGYGPELTGLQYPLTGWP